MIIHKIDIHLEDWSVSYPTGAIAYDVNGNIVDSDYCDKILAAKASWLAAWLAAPS